MSPASTESPADSNNRKSLAHSKIRDRRRIRMINPECARVLAQRDEIVATTGDED